MKSTPKKLGWKNQVHIFNGMPEISDLLFYQKIWFQTLLSRLGHKNMNQILNKFFTASMSYLPKFMWKMSEIKIFHADNAISNGYP